MSDLIKERQIIRLRKQRESMKTLYEHKRENILKKRKLHYGINREKIQSYKAIHYQKKKSQIYQRKRFKRYFPENQTASGQNPSIIALRRKMAKL